MVWRSRGRWRPGPGGLRPQQSSSSSSQAIAALPATQDDDEDRAGEQKAAAAAESSSSYYQQQALEPPTLNDYFLKKIASWVEARRDARESIRSIAVVASDDAASDIVSEGLTKAGAPFKHTVRINLPLVHYPSDYLGPNEVLCYTLRVCTIQKDNKDPNYVDKKIVQFKAWRQREHIIRIVSNKFEEHVPRKIQGLVSKIEDMESKINVKTVGGEKTRQTDGGDSKNEGTDGGSKTIEGNAGGSNTIGEKGGGSSRVKKWEGEARQLNK